MLENHYDEVFEFWIPGVCLTGISLLGFIGNLLSAVILSRPAMSSPMNTLLLGLTMYDTLLIVTSVMMVGVPSIHTHSSYVIDTQPHDRSVSEDEPVFNFYMSSIFPYITPIIYPVGMFCQSSSVYLTVFISLERWVAVCRPLQAKHICTQFRTRLAVLGTSILALGYNLPRFFEVKVYEVEDCKTFSLAPGLDTSASSQSGNVTNCFNVTDVATTDLRNNDIYIEIYMTWMYFVFMYIIPFSLLAVFNFLIYRKIKRPSQIRTSVTRSQAREQGLATMLFCVVAVFFVCNLLALVVNILEHLDQTYHELTQTNNLLVTVNSSVNFIIYCIFSDKFKRMLSSLVWGMLGRTDLARKYQNTVTYRINDQPSQAAFLLRKMSTSPLLPSRCQQPQGQLQSASSTARVLSTPTTSSTSLQPALSHLPQPRSSADFNSVADSQQANKMKCFLSKSQSASYLK